jgi:hypothetical protein
VACSNSVLAGAVVRYLVVAHLTFPCLMLQRGLLRCSRQILHDRRQHLHKSAIDPPFKAGFQGLPALAPNLPIGQSEIEKEIDD